MNAPKPPNHETAVRWNENAKRRRMLEGAWTRDLQDRILEDVSGRRASVWGRPDTSSNICSATINELSRLYDRAVAPLNEAEGASEVMRGLLNASAHWQKMQGFAPLIIGMREGLVRVDVVKDPISGEIELLTSVTPADLVHVEAHGDAPDEPYRVYEYIVRPNARGESVWTRDVWDISDPSMPYKQTQTEDGDPIDGTTIAGDEYLERWSYASGVPFLPSEWYHAQRTGKLTNERYGHELFEGTLSIASKTTFINHIIVDSSWPQRWMINARPVGAMSHEGEGAPHIDMDPTAILAVEPIEPGIGVSMGQFAPGGDAKVLGEAVAAQASRLALHFGVSGSDIERASGDARSGYAVELTQDGLRKAQAKYEQPFSLHDSRMLNKISAMATRAGLATLPDTGWRVEYSGIPLTLSERSQQLDEFEKMLAMELISKPEVLAKIEAIPLSEARARLLASQDDIKRFS